MSFATLNEQLLRTFQACIVPPQQHILLHDIFSTVEHSLLVDTALSNSSNHCSFAVYTARRPATELSPIAAVARRLILGKTTVQQFFRSRYGSTILGTFKSAMKCLPPFQDHTMGAPTDQLRPPLGLPLVSLRAPHGLRKMYLYDR